MRYFGLAFAALARTVDRVEQPLERDADGAPVAEQRADHDRNQQNGCQASGQEHALLGGRLQACFGEGNRQATDDLGFAIVVVDNLFRREERARLDLIDRSDDADGLVQLVIDRGALDVGIDGQRGEDKLDLLVGDVPQRFGNRRALDSDQLFELVLELEISVAAGAELEQPEDGNRRKQDERNNEREELGPDRVEG